MYLGNEGLYGQFIIGKFFTFLLTLDLNFTCGMEYISSICCFHEKMMKTLVMVMYD